MIHPAGQTNHTSTVHQPGCLPAIVIQYATHPHQRRVAHHIGRGRHVPVSRLLQQPGQQLGIGAVRAPRLRACVVSMGWDRAGEGGQSGLHLLSHPSQGRQTPCCWSQRGGTSAMPNSNSQRQPCAQTSLPLARSPAYRLRSRSTRCSRSRSSGAPSSTPSTLTRSWAALSPRTYTGRNVHEGTSVLCHPQCLQCYGHVANDRCTCGTCKASPSSALLLPDRRCPAQLRHTIIPSCRTSTRGTEASRNSGSRAR